VSDKLASNTDAHVKSPFYMNSEIQGFRNYELFKHIVRILNWRILNQGKAGLLIQRVNKG